MSHKLQSYEIRLKLLLKVHYIFIVIHSSKCFIKFIMMNQITFKKLLSEGGGCYPPIPIIKNLSKGIKLHLSKNSATVNIFIKAAKPYNTALKEKRHKQKLKYTKKRKATRKSRQIKPKPCYLRNENTTQ